MNTKLRTLPVRDYLDIGLSVAGIRIERNPQPGYQLEFRLRMHNKNDSSIRLEGRKWIMKERGGNTRIVEAATIFNQLPVLTPGAVFSYGGCQKFATPPLSVELSFFGTDSRNRPFITPPFLFPRRAYSLPW